MSSRAVADALGTEVRIVQLWARGGCPHGRDGRALVFNLEEVRGWLKTKGLDPRQPLGAALKPVAAAKSKKAPPPAAAPAAPAPVDECSILVDRIERMRSHLDEWLKQKPDKKAGVIAQQQWSAATKNLSMEIRQLEERLIQAEQRRRDWIRRLEALQMVSELAEALVSGVDALESAGSAKVGGVIGKYVDAESAAAASRECAVALRDEIDKLKRSLARVVERRTEDGGA